jgi:hypothetical protein
LGKFELLLEIVDSLQSLEVGEESRDGLIELVLVELLLLEKPVELSGNTCNNRSSRLLNILVDCSGKGCQVEGEFSGDWNNLFLQNSVKIGSFVLAASDELIDSLIEARIEFVLLRRLLRTNECTSEESDFLFEFINAKTQSLDFEVGVHLFVFGSNDGLFLLVESHVVAVPDFSSFSHAVDEKIPLEQSLYLFFKEFQSLGEDIVRRLGAAELEKSSRELLEQMLISEGP